MSLTRVDGHAIWVNSSALEMADINLPRPDPPGGRIDARCGRRSDGGADRQRKGPRGEKDSGTHARAARGVAGGGGAACAKVGLTTVHDAGIGQPTLDAYRALLRNGRLPIRIYAMILLPSNQDLWVKYQARGPEIGDFLTVRSLKLLADGALGSRGAAMLEPYTDDPGNSGLLILSRDYIEKKAREAIAAGFQVNTHAIGDRANRMVLQAYEAALRDATGKGNEPGAQPGLTNDRRFRVEHAQIVAPEDFRVSRDNSIIASMQPTHATSDMPWAAARVGGKRIQGAYAWQTMRKLGVHLAFGSDFPVEDPNPIWGFYSAITRQDHEGSPAGGWFPEQRLTRAERCEAGRSRALTRRSRRIARDR